GRTFATKHGRRRPTRAAPHNTSGVSSWRGQIASRQRACQKVRPLTLTPLPLNYARIIRAAVPFLILILLLILISPPGWKSRITSKIRIENLTGRVNSTAVHPDPLPQGEYVFSAS